MSTDIVNRWLKYCKNKKSFDFRVRDYAVLYNGTTISIQASQFHYCKPKSDNTEYYTHVEIMPDVFNVDSDEPGAYVDVNDLAFYIMVHGGIQNMPDGKVYEDD